MCPERLTRPSSFQSARLSGCRKAWRSGFANHYADRLAPQRGAIHWLCKGSAPKKLRIFWDIAPYCCQVLHSGDACTGTDSSQSIGYQSGMAKHGGYDVDRWTDLFNGMARPARGRHNRWWVAWWDWRLLQRWWRMPILWSTLLLRLPVFPPLYWWWPSCGAESVVKEVDELISISDSVGNARNPLISIHETTQFEIQSVIAVAVFIRKRRCAMKNILRSFTPLSPSSKAGLNSIWRQTSISHGMTLFGSAAAMVVAGYVVMAKINYALMKSAVPKVLRGVMPWKKTMPGLWKALLVLVYRRRNRSISPAVAVATLMILKRWYHSLFELTGQTHPVYLTTGVIQRSMDNQQRSFISRGSQYRQLQRTLCQSAKLVNHQSFTLVTLQYVSDGQYTNQTNLTRKARKPWRWNSSTRWLIPLPMVKMRWLPFVVSEHSCINPAGGKWCWENCVKLPVVIGYHRLSLHWSV